MPSPEASMGCMPPRIGSFCFSVWREPPWSRWFSFVLFVLLFILLVIWYTCWLVEVLSMMFYFLFVGWGHCWCFSWLLASCACVSWLCSFHFLFLDLNHVDSSMRVHSGRLPSYVSDRSVATVARYPTSLSKKWVCVGSFSLKKSYMYILMLCSPKVKTLYAGA